jgi:hypothetical protein
MFRMYLTTSPSVGVGEIESVIDWYDLGPWISNRLQLSEEVRKSVSVLLWG